MTYEKTRIDGLGSPRINRQVVQSKQSFMSWKPHDKYVKAVKRFVGGSCQAVGSNSFCSFRSIRSFFSWQRTCIRLPGEDLGRALRKFLFFETSATGAGISTHCEQVAC